MIRILFVMVVLVALTGIYSCSKDTGVQKDRVIIVLVENRLAFPMQDSIEQFKLDLEKEGYRVIVRRNIAATASPSEIRSILRDEYRKDKSLVGAILVGKVSAPLYNEKANQGDPYWHDHLSDLYYMDLDGIWEDTNGDGTYDEHRNFNIRFVDKLIREINRVYNIGGNYRGPEIWVSRLRADTLPSLGDEVTLLRNYFVRNHSYRTGEMPVPPSRAFVITATIDVLKTEWGNSIKELYTDLTIVPCQDASVASFKHNISMGDGYEWGFINVSSGPRIHHFHYKSDLDPSWWGTKDGRTLIAKYLDKVHKSTDITWLDVKTINPKILFYYFLASEIGRYDSTDYLTGTYIFSGWGLAAIADTQHAGASGLPILYKGLSSGKGIGEAWKDSLSWSIEHTGEEHTVYWCDGRKDTHAEGVDPYMAVLIGDGTLRLPGKQ